MANVGDRLTVPPFYVAFILAPLASNASEFIASFAYAGILSMAVFTYCGLLTHCGYRYNFCGHACDSPPSPGILACCAYCHTRHGHAHYMLTNAYYMLTNASYVRVHHQGAYTYSLAYSLLTYH